MRRRLVPGRQALRPTTTACAARAAVAVAAAVVAVLVAGVLAPLAPFAGAQPATNAALGEPVTTVPTLPTFPPLSTAGGMLSRSAHVAFEGCRAKDVTLTVSIARHPFPTLAPVTYAVVVTNHGDTACGPPLDAKPPFGPGTLTVGPCGQVPATVADASGRSVYPGPVAFSCPMYEAAHLGAHASLIAQGSWMRQEATGGGPHGGAVLWRTAPPGPYHLTVDGVVRVPFTLATATPPAG